MDFDRFDPNNCVLVVIDVQNDFCHPDGSVAKDGKDVSECVKMVPRLNEFIASVRELQIPIVFVATTHSPESTSDAWKFRTGSSELVAHCAPETWGAEFYSMEVMPEDFVVTKHRYSAFTSPEFSDKLKDLGRRSLLFTGVATNICVETTLRDATCADYFSTLIEDCCSAYSLESHQTALESIRSTFGVVMDSTALMSHWTKYRELTGSHPGL